MEVGQAQDARFIRLRNGTITTPEPRHAALASAVATTTPATSGLFLIQVADQPQPTWRQELESRGVTLLYYVPDQAYVARFNQVHPTAVRALPFVRWIGAYTPEMRVHPRVTAAFSADLQARIPVKLLIPPGTGGPQIAQVLRILAGPVTHHTMGMGTFVTGQADLRRLSVLARSDAVVWIERAPHVKPVDEISTKIVAGETDRNGDFAHVQQLGFDGRGVVVAVADSGLDSGDITDMHPDVAGRVDALFAYDGLADARDEHSHGTHVAGIVAGNASTGETDDSGAFWGLGVAPGAHLVVERIFDGAGNFRSPPTYARLMQDAVRSGAYVGSNSWGDDVAGQYDLSAAEFDGFVRDADPDVPGEQPYVLEFSAGNAGPGSQSIDSPAVAKNVIATGATQNNRYEFPIYGDGQEVMADFSSRGPCEDGRIKPDITAPGTWISSLRSVYANDDNAWGPISDYYMYQGGTSQAGPHASGAAAVVVQWYRSTHGGVTPSPALVKAMLINSADDMGTATIPDNGGVLGGDDGTDPGSLVVGDTGPVPNNDEGWGRINLVNLIDSSRTYTMVDQNTLLGTGDFYEQRVVVGPDEPLKITLVYTDVPALPAAIPALVNDLDLEVVAPDGRLFRGNAFGDGESAPETPEGDRINNVEAVHLAAPAAGEYIVRVRAHQVAMDVHGRTIPVPVQDFTLVVSGQLPKPGEGVVSWDRDAFQSPAVATVRLVDADLADRTDATVQVWTSAHTNRLTLTLKRTGTNGSFSGTVQLAPGNADNAAGRLTANDGDTIWVDYADAHPAGDRQSSAQIDSQPPVLSDVNPILQFGHSTIEWLSGEPATSIVWYGTTNAVTNRLGDGVYRTQHSIDLPPLTPGSTYFFAVAGSDAAGNTSTNDNGGHYFRFIGPRPASALLVYSPESLFAPDGFLGDTPYPGVENWTDTLDSLGVEYDVWDISVVGTSPKASDLKAYGLVFWRPEELAAPAPGLTDALTTYLQNGGALFVSSFDLITRLKEGNATNFISDVLLVAAYQEDQGANVLNAVPGDPVGGGIQVPLDYSAFPSGFAIDLLGISWPDGPDHLTAGTNAAASFVQEDRRVVGVRSPKTGQDSQGRIVFLSVAFEAITTDGAAPNNRASVMGNALRFLRPGLATGASVAFDQPAYTIPSSVAIEVTDSKRATNNQVAATLRSTSNPAGVPLTLFATPVPGVFRTRAVLGARATGTAPPTLVVTNGETLTAVYIDGAHTENTVAVPIDTVPPIVSGVAADPAYNEAVITWTTDKPSDSLVRFGTSAGDDSFLNRSAYVSESTTDHEVQLSGLLADHVYYFKVVSRDDAGNIGSDDAAGKLYSVRTLTPLLPPWTDGLEKGHAGWAVYNDSGGTGATLPGDPTDDGSGDTLSGSGWDFGVPVNTYGVTAHSGTNVWATNLNGDSVDYAISDLISPAISLVGGNKATLRFWQNYDFTSASAGGGDDDTFGDFLVEAGQVALSTDDGATWNDLYTVQDDLSDGWEPVEVDVTQFVGNIVRFRFNYQLFSFNPSPRLGWLLDDFSVDLNTVASTSLVVSNNLAQATFILRGPTNLVVNGAGLVFRTNVPSGTYSIEWKPVPYYIAPGPQTNTLGTSTNALVFNGNYTFPDKNGNGISDLWETAFFGSVNPLYTGRGDTDGDGASDFAEFIAGTSPKDSTSSFQLKDPQTLSNGTVRLEWTTVPGHSYRLDVTTDFKVWQPVTDTLTATDATLSTTLPALDPHLAYFFRVWVTP